jgi:FMN-dependent NADH-azoreductase
MGEDSISRRLTAEFVQRWRRANPQGEVISRDLTTIAIPVIDAAWISANLAPKESRTQQQNEILALSTEFTKELLDADEYAIGIPMHNWGPSSSFKLWADQIVRFGETIAVTPSGPKGALGAKQVTFFLAAGRRYDPVSAGPPTNHLEPWLRTFFGYLGVRNMKFVLADGTAEVKYGKIDRAAFLAPHIKAVQSLFAEAVSS